MAEPTNVEIEFYGKKLESDPDACPFCDSAELVEDEFERNHGEVTVEVRCLNCTGTWCETYKTFIASCFSRESDDISNLEPPQTRGDNSDDNCQRKS